MKLKQYEREEVLSLLPLLASITRELEERSAAIERLESEIGRLSALPRPGDELRHAVAEAATHRRELRLARRELERLGCSVVGTEPFTLRIPGKFGEASKSFVWQAGDPVLE